jgi:predicted nucleic acid-binding protein
LSGVSVDASTLINFLLLDRVDLLGSLNAFDFLVPTEVKGEILDETQRARLEAGFASGHLAEIQLASPEELATYAELRDRLGAGESACLALAAHRELLVACDDRAAVRIADQLLGPDRLLNTPGLLVLAITEGHLAVNEADSAKAVLEENRFTMAFESFADLQGRGYKE